MKARLKQMSLQWRLTLLTALLVTTSCLVLQFSLSRSAVNRMDLIETTVVDGIAEEYIVSGDDAVFRVDLDIPTLIEESQYSFRLESVIITLIIVLFTSSITYFLVGYALSPVKKLTEQAKQIRAGSIDQALALEKGPKEIVQLSKTFDSMLKRLEKSFETQRQFSASAAHELRTPLAVMQTKIEVLQKQDPSVEEYKESIENLRGQAERLSHVIDVLMEMTELESATVNEPVALSELTEEVLMDLQEPAEKRKVTLECSENEEEITILGSEILVYRALYNLVENAIKYNKKGGTVTVSTKKENQKGLVLITDTGIGIKSEDWDKIFEAFYRVDKSRSREMGGAGLGLSLVKKIAELHGGEVKVVASGSEGTTIAISFQMR